MAPSEWAGIAGEFPGSPASLAIVACRVPGWPVWRLLRRSPCSRSAWRRWLVMGAIQAAVIVRRPTSPVDMTRRSLALDSKSLDEQRRKSGDARRRKKGRRGDDQSPACPSTEWSRSVATQPPRRRKAADASPKKTVKTSLTLDVDLHARLNAAASLAGTSTNAFVVDVLTEALRGLILIDKRKSGGQDDSTTQ